MGDPGLSATSPELEWLRPGTHVEVRNRFTGTWSRGFDVVDVGPDGYTIRRLSDRSVLPVLFPADDVRPRPPRKTGLWWYQ